MLIPTLVFFAALVGGAASWFGNWNERRLHIALALSTGTFLGAVFLHLLPEVAERAVAASHQVEVTAAVEAAAHGHDHAGGHDHADGHDHDHGPAEDSHGPGHNHGDPTVWLCVLAGVLLVHGVEALFLRTTEQEGVSRHKSVSIVTLAGVSVHAASAGLGLSAFQAGASLDTSLLTAFLAHKALESFALVNVFQLAHITGKKVAGVLFLFALITPASLLAGGPLFEHLGAGAMDVVTGFAAGTFLYVSVAELLPEVFHHRGDNLPKFGFLLLGIVLSVVLVGAGV